MARQVTDTPRRVVAGFANPDIHTGGPPQPSVGSPMTPPTPAVYSREYLDDTAKVQRLVTRELEQWTKDLQPFYDDVNDSWAKWNLQPVGDDNPFLSSVQSAYPLYAVEQILPRILGTNPSMTYAPLDNQKDDLVAILLGKVTSWQMRKMGFEYAARDFVRQALVARYSIGKVGWIRQTEIRDTSTTEQHPFVKDEQHLGNFTVQVPGKERVTIRNEPFFEVVNILDFVWPLRAKSIPDATAVWQRRWIRLGELQEKQADGFYQNIDQVTPSDSNRWTQAYEPQFTAQGLAPQPPMTQTGEQDNADALIEVWERWADDRLITIASRRICIRDEANPFWHKRKPYIDFTPIPRPFQMHGQSIIDCISDSNEALSTLMRQVTDAVTYLINPAFKSTEGVDWGNFVFQPGAHLDLPDTEDVQPLTMPNVDLQAALSWRMAHLEDMQRYAGVFDLMGGFPMGGMHTATGVSTVIQQATMRITEMINVLSYRAMRPFGYMMERLNAQYLDEGILVDFDDDPTAQAAWQKFVADEQPVGVLAKMRDMIGGTSTPAPQGLVHIKAEMLRAQGRLEPIPQVGQDETLSDTQKKSDATQALQAIAPILASPMNPINMKALADWMLQQMGMPPEDRDKVMATPPAQQQAIAQAAQAAPPGASGPGGENLPTGGVVGAPGAAGGNGPSGMGAGR